MASVNKVILIGNLGRDPEVKYTASGVAICNITVATSRSWKNKDSGEKVEETEWHRLVAYERTAEVIGEYLRKGSSAYFEGRLKTRKWQDKDGVERYTTEIVVEQMKMLGGRPDRGDGEQSAPARQHAASAQPPARAAAPRPTASSGFDGMDDDVPF